MFDLGSTMRIIRPSPGVIGFYDGRIPGVRAFSEEPNWLDDGAFSLGTCTYAIVDGPDALVYDTHLSIAHARLIRRTLEQEGAGRIRVVLSHWHKDHVAGNGVFADCEIIAHRLTAEALAANRAAIEAGRPPIRPLVMPTRTHEGSLALEVGSIPVELRHADIHSHDGTLLFLPERGLLFAGDALEDPITYVTEPDRLSVHLRDLDRLATWPVRTILPNHGDPQVIAAGGYGPGLVGATRRYVEALLRSRTDPALAAAPLAAWIAPDAAAGHLHPFAAYEEVHRHNLDAVRRAG